MLLLELVFFLLLTGNVSAYFPCHDNASERWSERMLAFLPLFKLSDTITSVLIVLCVAVRVVPLGHYRHAGHAMGVE